MKKIICTILLLISVLTVYSQNATISGFVKDKANGEELIGASVIIKGTNTGAVTNTYGFYSITLPQDNYTIVYSYLGYTEVEKTFSLKENVSLNISLSESAEIINEVVLSATKLNENITNTEMSVTSLSSKEIKKMPQLLGEVDIIRSLTLLPGISTVGEVATGFNVRGGNADQNLILLDEAPVFNSSHLLGLFSVFNSDAVKDAKMYKGGIPAKYGGRLSSVLDVRQKEGNSKEFGVNGGVGLLSSRLMIEGPVLKDKISFMVAGRRSYLDIFFPLSDKKEIQKSILYFYDFNAKVNYRISNKSRLFLSGYFGKDQFGIDEQFAFGWGNATATLRWNYLLSDKLFSNISAVYSDYKYNLGTPENAESQFRWDSRIQNYIVNSSFTWYANPNNKVDFGFNTTFYEFSPAKISGAINSELQHERAFEPALFISNEQSIGSRIKVQYGLRYSWFYNVGPRKVLVYADDALLEPENVIDTNFYSDNEIVASFISLEGFEPRFSINYLINEKSSIKVSYNKIRQYIHLISNTTNATPIDIWRPSGTYIQPSSVHQIAAGYFRNFDNHKYNFSVETYYKKFNNLVDYKDGAALVFTEYIETELLSGTGEAYGIELLVEKKIGKLTGFIGYTLSRSTRTVSGSTPEETINQGNAYYANFDKTHDLTFLATYAISKRFDLSAIFAFQTGRPMTTPDSKGQLEGFSYPNYLSRNNGRIPNYHRLDLSAVYYFKNNLDKESRFKTNLAFGVYNAYGRKNPYSISFQNGSEPYTNQIIQLSIFGSVIPYVTFNFSF